MNHQYRLERIAEEKIQDFISLFEAVHGVRLDYEKVKGKFATEFTGAKFIGYLAYSEDSEVVSYYGVFPTLVYINGAIVLAAQSGDTMTHPNHRRKGLFEKLFSKTSQLAKTEKIKFIFGFPNLHNSYPGLLKFGWKEIHRMNSFEKVIAYNLYDKVRNKFFKKKSSIQAQRGDYNLVEKFMTSRNRLYYGRDYMEYKKYSDNHLLQLNHGIIWAKTDFNQLIIGMIKVTSNAIFNEITSIAKKQKCRTIVFESSPNSESSAIFENKDEYKLNQGLPALIYEMDQTIDVTTLTFVRADFDTF